MVKKKSGMKSERLMSKIRTQGQVWLFWFAIIFVISVFAGLGVGSFSRGFSRGTSPDGSPLGPDGDLSSDMKYVAEIGDAKVDWAKFYEYFSAYRSSNENMSPEEELEAMNLIVESVIRDESIRAYGRNHGLSVSEDEVRGAIATMKAQFTAAESSDEGGGTILGELQRSLKTNDAGEQRWKEWLASRNMTERDLYRMTEDELFLDRIKKSLEEEITSRKEEIVESVKQIVESELQEGTEFTDLAKLFSYDFYTRKDGGEIPTNISIGLFSTEFDKAVWTLKNPGDITPWFENEFGWEKVQLIEKIPKEKAETSEEMKDELIDLLRRQKGDDEYEPSEDELAWAYEAKHTRMRVRHITLSNMPNIDFNFFVSDLVKAQSLSIYHPLVRGYRAISGHPNNRDLGVEPPIEVKLFLPAEDYGIIENGIVHEDRIEEGIELVNAGKWPDEASWYVPPAEPEMPEPTESVETDSADGSEPSLADADEAEVEIDVDEEPEEEPVSSVAEDTEEADRGPFVSEPPGMVDEPGPPRYPEALEAFEAARDSKAFKDQANVHFYVAWCYEKWLGDEKYKDEIPIGEDEVLTIIEDEYRAAVETYKFEPFYHLSLAKFLLDQERNDEALESADLALEYAGLNKPVLQELNGIYRKLDNEEMQAKVKEKLEIISKREEEERQGSSQSFPIEFGGQGGDSNQPIKIEIPSSGSDGE